MRLLNFLIAIVGFMFMVSDTGFSEADDQSARSVFLAEQHSLVANSSFASLKPVEVRRSVRARYSPDPTIVAMVDKVADESGIPRNIMRFHVQKESGFNPRARNPSSTATGLLQLIKGSHEVIAGKILTKEQHFRLAMEPEYNLRLGAAHIRECMRSMPGASAENLWRRCHVRGHRSVGGDIRIAATHFKPDSSGWLARGSVAVPWASAFAERTT